MASPMCDAIHLTEVDDRKAPIKCDTFMPPVDMTQFRVWAASFPRIESGLRYSFVTYVRTPSAKTPAASVASASKVEGTESVTSTRAEGSTEATGGAPCRENGGGGDREAEAGGEGSADLVMEVRNGFKGAGASAVERLPKSILEKHEERQYLNLIEEIIREGVHKGDRTGTGTISKFGCSVRRLSSIVLKTAEFQSEVVSHTLGAHETFLFELCDCFSDMLIIMHIEHVSSSKIVRTQERLVPALEMTHPKPCPLSHSGFILNRDPLGSSQYRFLFDPSLGFNLE
jgi:hypothetical protein